VRLPPLPLCRHSSSGAWRTALESDGGCCSRNTSTSASLCAGGGGGGGGRVGLVPAADADVPPEASKANVECGFWNLYKTVGGLSPIRSGAPVRGNASASCATR
jgi:hypothetical protein